MLKDGYGFMMELFMMSVFCYHENLNKEAK